MDNEFSLLIALVLANWSALGTILKCRDKIDASRNLLWGLSSESLPSNKEMATHILRADIGGFSIGMFLILAAVGSILIVSSHHMSSSAVSAIITKTYGINGILMVLGSIWVAFASYRSYQRVTRHALARFEGTKIETSTESNVSVPD